MTDKKNKEKGKSVNSRYDSRYKRQRDLGCWRLSLGQGSDGFDGVWRDDLARVGFGLVSLEDGQDLEEAEVRELLLDDVMALEHLVVGGGDQQGGRVVDLAQPRGRLGGHHVAQLGGEGGGLRARPGDQLRDGQLDQEAALGGDGVGAGALNEGVEELDVEVVEEMRQQHLCERMEEPGLSNLRDRK